MRRKPVVEGRTLADQLEIFGDELEALVRELQRRMPDNSLLHLTPAQLVHGFRSTAGRVLPRTQRELLADVEANLEEATFRELVEPDTLEGLWYIVSYTMQLEVSTAKEGIQDRVERIPGSSIVAAAYRGFLNGVLQRRENEGD